MLLALLISLYDASCGGDLLVSDGFEFSLKLALDFIAALNSLEHGDQIAQEDNARRKKPRLTTENTKKYRQSRYRQPKK